VTRPRLTSFTSGSGCACKFPARDLDRLLLDLSSLDSPLSNVLVGLEAQDDAAVVLLDHRALIHTVDVITPVLDDPREWGRVAAANALSDIYAMGGQPLLAVNLLSWPRESLPVELAREVLAGGFEIAKAAGCTIGGGHTIFDEEPKFGLSVVGIADPDKLLKIAAGTPGDPLVLTKPLGIGVLASLHKATAEPIPEAVAVMTSLNMAASEAAVVVGARCATDVTGYGLLGHLLRVAEASDVTALIDSKKVPILPGAYEAARAGYISGGTYRNLEWIQSHVEWPNVDETTRLLFADAQTSGGLIVAGDVPGARIGELRRRTSTPLIVA
jgi:selenide, water dikinase